GPVDTGLGSVDVGQGPVDVGHSPDDVGLDPADVGLGLDHVGRRLAEAGARSSEADARTSERDGRSNQADARTSEADGRSNQADARTSEVDGRSNQADARTSEVDGRSNQADARTSEVDGRSSQADARTSEADGRSSQADARTSEADGQSSQADAREALLDALLDRLDASRADSHIAGVDTPTRHGGGHLVEDLLGFAAGDAGEVRQLQKMAARRGAPFSGDGHGVLARGAGGEDEVVGGRQCPASFGGQPEGEVLYVIVPVVRQDVEGHPAVALQDVRMILRQDARRLQKLAVVAARDAEVGVDEVAEGVHVDPGQPAAGASFRLFLAPEGPLNLARVSTLE